MQGNDQKGIFLISGFAALIGGLCCMTPIILVLLGLASISAAAGLGNVLYGEYRWEFRIAALAFLALALGIYFRRRGICTLDEARRQRQRIINTSLLVLVFSVGIYVFWTYIAVHYWGIAVGLPWAQYDESWAVPVSATLLGLAIVLYVILFRGSRRTQAKETQNGSSRASKTSP